MSLELLKRYQSEYGEFCKIDVMNLDDRVKRVPAEKHHWVARLIDHKILKDKLLKKKSHTKQGLIDGVVGKSPVSIGKTTLNEQLESAPSIEQLNEQIKENDFVIEYLELVVKNVTFIAQDFKNIISTIQLEQGF